MPKRLSLRHAALCSISSVGLCCLVVLLRVSYMHDMWNWWNDPTIVGFLAAWIPFVISFLLAFIPDSKMKKRARIIWRVAVLSVGLMYSLILWHQQVLNQVLAAQDQQKLLDKSNSHSDEEIGTVRGDVRVLQHDLKQTASKNDVTQTATVITGILTKSQQDLNEKLEKLKPVTPEIADVRFSLFTDTFKTSDPPILNTAIKAQKDGTFPVDVFFTNVSGTSVEAMDVWITLCPLCFFASELPGFDRPAGTDEQTRHLIIPLLNPGTSYPKITILVKSNLKPPFSFWVNFRHACKVCGKNPDQQVLRIAALPMPLS